MYASPLLGLRELGGGIGRGLKGEGRIEIVMVPLWMLCVVYGVMGSNIALGKVEGVIQGLL